MSKSKVRPRERQGSRVTLEKGRPESEKNLTGKVGKVHLRGESKFRWRNPPEETGGSEQARCTCKSHVGHWRVNTYVCVHLRVYLLSG